MINQKSMNELNISMITIYIYIYSSDSPPPIFFKKEGRILKIKKREWNYGAGAGLLKKGA